MSYLAHSFCFVINIGFHPVWMRQVSSVVGSTNGVRMELFSRYSNSGEWGVSMSITEIAMLPINSYQLTDTSYMVNSPHPYEKNTYYVFSLVIMNQASTIGNRHGSGKKLTEEVSYDLSFGALTNVNAGYDYLSVYSGEGTNGNLLFSHSGGINEWPEHVVVHSAVGITAALQTDYKDPQEGVYLTITKSLNSYVQDRIHTVVQEGRVYSTLSDINIDGGPFNSQSFPLVLPPGWSIADDDKISRAVARSFAWNTEVIVFADGSAFTTASMKSLSGRFVESYMSHIHPVVSPDGATNSYSCIERMYRCQILIMKNDIAPISISSNDAAIDTTVIIISVVLSVFAFIAFLVFIFRSKVLACIDGCVYGYGGAGEYNGVAANYENENRNDIVARSFIGDVVKGPMSGGVTTDPVAIEIGGVGFASSDFKRLDNAQSNGLSTALVQAQVVNSARDVRGASPATMVTVDRHRGATAPAMAQATTIPIRSVGDSSNAGGGEMVGSHWVERYSTTYNRKFWKNTITGKSTWIDPLLPQPPQIGRPVVTPTVAPPPPAPASTSFTPGEQDEETVTTPSGNNDDADEEVELIL